jgi:hypothetical protein
LEIGDWGQGAGIFAGLHLRDVLIGAVDSQERVEEIEYAKQALAGDL